MVLYVCRNRPGSDDNASGCTWDEIYGIKFPGDEHIIELYCKNFCPGKTPVWDRTFHPSDICANCGHTFQDHGFYGPVDPMTIEEPLRSHIDCKKIIGKNVHGHSVQCECYNFMPG